MQKDLRSLNLELKEADAATRDNYRRAKDEHQSAVDGLEEEVTELNDRVLDARIPDESEENVDQTYDRIDAIQMDDIERMRDMNKKVNRMGDMGVAINNTLQEDNRIIYGINDDLTDIEDGLAQSKRALTGIARRLQRDNLIRCLMVLVVLGIIFVLLWELVLGDLVNPESTPSDVTS
eukprot:TRINITY_DN5134_c0_g1_i1.p1 TRINITY_DN5134_c0_g1~~TRINITY_DN5134_c0_g1_i1.p1  ORF type:complete len:178 (-),score=51.70 TRINITY_DN5134_c0_g1_i1:17-550(-)